MVLPMVNKNSVTDQLRLLTPPFCDEISNVEKSYFRSVKGYVADKKKVGNVCRTCYRAIFTNNYTKFYDDSNKESSEKIRKMLSEVTPFVNLDIYENPIMCNQCLEYLYICYEFKTKCTSTEQQFQKWIQQRKGVAKTDVNLLILVEASEDDLEDDPEELSTEELQIKDEIEEPHFPNTDHNYYFDPSAHNSLIFEVKKRKRFSYKPKICEKEISKMVLKPRKKVLKGDSLCEKCGQVIDTSSDTCGHCKYESEGKKRQHVTLDCRHCGKCFKNPECVQAHEKTTHMDTLRFLCCFCGKEFKYRCSLQVHFLKHGDGNETKMSCDKCKKTFVNKENYIGHVISCYKKIKKYKCNICYVTYWKRNNFIKHKNQVHMRGNRRKCYMCGIGFSTQDEFVKHLTDTHLSEDDYQCETCHKLFSNKASFAQHVSEAHSKLSPQSVEDNDNEEGSGAALDYLEDFSAKRNYITVKDLESLL